MVVYMATLNDKYSIYAQLSQECWIDIILKLYVVMKIDIFVIILEMFEFQFDAPRYKNLRKLKKRSNIIEIDTNNPNDLWFLMQHQELTPIKPKLDDNVQFKKDIDLNNQNQRNDNKERRGEAIHKQSKGLRNILKRDKMMSYPFLNKQKKNQYSLSKEESLKSREIPLVKPLKRKEVKAVEDTKSQNLTDKKMRKKVRRPCPFPIKVQRQWQTSSHRSWYSLSEKSAEKATRSMQKKCLKRGQNSKKNNNKRSFRF